MLCGPGEETSKIVTGGGGGGSECSWYQFFKHYTQSALIHKKLYCKKLHCWIRYFYTQGFTLKNY